MCQAKGGAFDFGGEYEISILSLSKDASLHRSGAGAASFDKLTCAAPHLHCVRRKCTYPADRHGQVQAGCYGAPKSERTL
jgi:hypothetical protein